MEDVIDKAGKGDNDDGEEDENGSDPSVTTAMVNIHGWRTVSPLAVSTRGYRMLKFLLLRTGGQNFLTYTTSVKRRHIRQTTNIYTSQEHPEQLWARRVP